MTSARLRFVRVGLPTLAAFHSLVENAHVRRDLLAGQGHPRDWSAARIRDSKALFEPRGVGLWLAHEWTLRLPAPAAA